jgi:hypothetical protein
VYAYAGGSPVMGVDPRGLQSISIPVPGGMSIPALGGPIPICIAIFYSVFQPVALSNAECPCVPPPMMTRPPGFWPADSGAAEWGRRNGVGPREGKNKFHGIKRDDPGSRGDDAYGVNPDTGDISRPDGEVIGNLND